MIFWRLTTLRSSEARRLACQGHSPGSKDKILETDSKDVRSTLLAYLGESLDAPERAQFERLLLDQDLFSRQVEEAEFALIEDYVDGTLAPGEQEIVAAWVERSPRHRAQAAIAAGLRSSAARGPGRRKARLIMWSLAAAACVALAIAAPLLLRGRTPASVVAENTRPPVVTPAAPFRGDTILLDAERLRSSGVSPVPVTYALHANLPTRLQIIVPKPQPGAVYSIDLRPVEAQSPASAIHRTGLHLAALTPLPYIEVLLEPHSLAPGRYAGELHSPSGAYALNFSVAAAH